jgi:hypothetical protein
MNENYEDQRRRASQEGREPRILSIEESEPEERPPPGPPMERYPPDRSRREGVSPRIVEKSRESKTGTLLKILVLMLICLNVGLFWLYQQQDKEIEELASKALNQSLEEVSVRLENEEPEIRKSFRITVEGLSRNLFSKYGLNPDKITAEIVILKDGEEFDSRVIALGTSEIEVMPNKPMGKGSYNLKLKITYRGIVEEIDISSIPIQGK